MLPNYLGYIEGNPCLQNKNILHTGDHSTFRGVRIVAKIPTKIATPPKKTLRESQNVALRTSHRLSMCQDVLTKIVHNLTF